MRYIKGVILDYMGVGCLEVCLFDFFCKCFRGIFVVFWGFLEYNLKIIRLGVF